MTANTTTVLPDARAREVRLRMFLEILEASCGQADASDYRWNWINAFCGENEGYEPDTFNTAHDAGYTTVSHDTDTDSGIVRLTEVGRVYLTTPPASDAAVPAGEVRRNPDDPEWDNCPACKTGSLDTGYECNSCGFDAQPLVHLQDACEARGERMHPSGLYESEIENPIQIAAAPKVASDTGAGLLRTISRAIHEHLCRRDIMQYLDNDEDCEGLARAVTAALATDATDGATGGGEVGTGWVAWNPDTGEEYSPNHPVRSGECVEAERIRPSTPQEDVLWQAFQGEFERAHALETQLSTTPGGDLLEQAARVGKAIEDAWNGSGSDGRRNDLPPIDLTEHEREHIGAAAIRALSARNQTDEGGEK